MSQLDTGNGDQTIRDALERLGVPAVTAGLQALTTGATPDDWTANFLAASFGAPGELENAVRTHPKYFEDMSFRSVWDTELLDIVGEVMGLGESALLLQWYTFKDPNRLARLCAEYLARSTDRPIAWPIPPESPVQTGPPSRLRAKAVAFLRSKIDESSRAAALNDIRELGFEHWAQLSHLWFGMNIRNALRAEGFTEDALGIDNLDGHWAALFLDALQDPSGAAPSEAGSANVVRLWEMCGALVDHFAQLGGAARHAGFSEQEIACTVLILLMRRLAVTMPSRHRRIPELDQAFWEACDPVHDRIKALVEALVVHGELEAYDLLYGTLEQMRKRTAREPSARWRSIEKAVRTF